MIYTSLLEVYGLLPEARDQRASIVRILRYSPAVADRLHEASPGYSFLLGQFFKKVLDHEKSKYPWKAKLYSSDIVVSQLLDRWVYEHGPRRLLKFLSHNPGMEKKIVQAKSVEDALGIVDAEMEKREAFKDEDIVKFPDGWRWVVVGGSLGERNKKMSRQETAEIIDGLGMDSEDFFRTHDTHFARTQQQKDEIEVKTVHCWIEGRRMSHCGLDSQGDLISLRDPKGTPHVTMTWNSKENVVYQVKGKMNKIPDRVYWDRIEGFFQKTRALVDDPNLRSQGKELYDKLAAFSSAGKEKGQEQQ